MQKCQDFQPRQEVQNGMDNIDIQSESTTAGLVGYHGLEHVIYRSTPGNTNDIGTRQFSKNILEVLEVQGAKKKALLFHHVQYDQSILYHT